MEKLKLNTLVVPVTVKHDKPIVGNVYLSEYTEKGILDGYKFGSKYCGYRPEERTILDPMVYETVKCTIPIVFMKGRFQL